MGILTDKIKDLRAITESILRNAQRKLTILLEIEKGYTEFVQNQIHLKQMNDEQSTNKILLDQLEVQIGNQKSSLTETIVKIDYENKNLANTEQRIADLAIFQNIQNSFKKSFLLLKHYQEEAKILNNEESTFQKELLELTQKIDNLKLEIAKIRDDIKSKLSRRSELTNIQNDLDTLINSETSISILMDEISRLQIQRESRSKKIIELETTISSKNREIEILEKEYERNISNQKELTNLLDDIELHVQSGLCPVCGTDHNSIEALIEKIHKQKEKRPLEIEKIVEKCNKIKILIKDDISLLQNLRSDDNQDKSRLEEINKQLAINHTIRNEFESRLIQLGLQKGINLNEQILVNLKELNAEAEKFQTIFIQKETDLKKAVGQMTELTGRSALNNKKLTEMNISIHNLIEETSGYKAAAQNINLNIDISEDDFLALNKKALSSKKRHLKEIKSWVDRKIVIEQELESLEKSQREISLKSGQIDQNKSKLDSKIQIFNAKAVPIFKTKLFSSEMIQESKKSAEQSVKELDDLRDKFYIMESALDSKMKTTQMVEQENSLKILERSKASLTEKLKSEKSAKKWLLNIKEILQKYSSNAVNEHIHTFGPLSSLIQRRLHAVYGFNDVQLSSIGSEIRIRVGWQNSFVNPSDYFSDSQKQILMLSIFLASRLTQSWSGFAPVMMDDPVTHFDDLNAFGFVELIRGILANTQGKKQFIISTCEERLFELMQKKFKNVSGGALFYKFTGIDQNVPIVDKYSN